ncbi:MAG: hypothetical protein V3V05_08705 [Pontiella sp.]
MNQQSSPNLRVWNYSMMVAAIVFMVGSTIILHTYLHNIVLKELFCSWLLVFFNAYIGTFIANKALKQNYTGFFVWSMLINGLRIGVFVMILLIILKTNILNNREFASITLFGYLVFLAQEVYSLHTQSLRVYQKEH